MLNKRISATPAPRTAAVPAHIATFGVSRMFGAPVSLFDPEPENGNEGGATAPAFNGLTRTQFINEQKAAQLDKSHEYLVQKNAELLADLHLARARVPKDGEVVISAADQAALAAYREQFPTPKDAKTAAENLGSLLEKDEQRSYDDARREAIAEFADLPEAFQKLIPTASELLERPGGREQLKAFDLLRSQVETIAGAYGTERQDKTKETDVGVSPTVVKSSGNTAEPNEARSAVTSFYSKQYPELSTQNKEG